jgi:hypothetical protein
MSILRVLPLIFAITLGVAACDKQGPMERAGERIDDASQDVGNAIEDACEDTKEGMNADDADC